VFTYALIYYVAIETNESKTVSTLSFANKWIIKFLAHLVLIKFSVCGAVVPVQLDKSLHKPRELHFARGCLLFYSRWFLWQHQTSVNITAIYQDKAEATAEKMLK
jgi:hypothetical protein